MSATEPPKTPQPAPAQPVAGRSALWVAAGIFLSRILGLVRERLLAHYLGNSFATAAFRTGQKIPNYLQNLFGEGVLSASFIPVYAGLLGKDDREAAERVANAVFGLLSLAVAVLVAVGVLGAPLFVDVLTPGLEGETRDLAVVAVRIAFPGTGLLVLSAWCLGVLNSHRRFFISYAAPVAWNLAIIATLVVFGGQQLGTLAKTVTWGTVAGAVLQFGVQLPTALKLLGHFRPTLSLADQAVRQVLRSFGPVVVGRGVVQISAFVDGAVATLISARAYSTLSYAQMLYLLPVSLFGMAVSAAELPEMSRAVGAAEQVESKLRDRLGRSMARIAFFVVPSVAAFLLLGDVVAGAVLQTGRFNAGDTRYTWYILMGSTVGLLAATLARLYASAFYAAKDTKTPLKFALIRVALGAGLSFSLALYLPGLVGLPPHLGAAFITAASGCAAWIEYLLLRRGLTRRIGPVKSEVKLATLWACAVGAGLIGLGVKYGLGVAFGVEAASSAEWGGSFLAAPHLYPILTALLVLGPYGLAYFAFAALAKIPEAKAVFQRVLRLARR